MCLEYFRERGIEGEIDEEYPWHFIVKRKEGYVSVFCGKSYGEHVPYFDVQRLGTDGTPDDTEEERFSNIEDCFGRVEEILQ